MNKLFISTSAIIIVLIFSNTSYPYLIPQSNNYGSADQRVVYIDSETGFEVWQLTDNVAVNHMIKKLEGECAAASYSVEKCDNLMIINRGLYYNSPAYSPDGRFILFIGAIKDPKNINSDLSRAHFRIINSDGSGESVFGNWKGSAEWNAIDVKEDKCNADGTKWTTDEKSFMRYSTGWWSKDSRYYLAGGGLFVVDVNTGGVFQLPALKNKDQALCFKEQVLSPDGLKVSAVDFTGGQYKLQFIDTRNGSLGASISLAGWTSDSHLYGWLGADYVFANIYGNAYCKDIVPTYVDKMYPIYKTDGTFTEKYLNPSPYSYAGQEPGNFDCAAGAYSHLTISPNAYSIGPNGLVGGDDRLFTVADSNFMSSSREIWALSEAVGKQIGTHSNFSPDEKWMVVENAEEIPGVAILYPAKKDAKESPVKLMRHRTLKSYCLTGDNSNDCKESKKYTWRCSSPKGRFADDDMTLQEFKELDGLALKNKQGAITKTEKIKLDSLLVKKNKFWGSCLGEYPWPTWSPDGTKIVYWSFDNEFMGADGAVKRDENIENIYAAAVKKPSAPIMLGDTAMTNGTFTIKWKPAMYHKEIKEYEILGSNEENGEYSVIAEVLENHAYLKEEMKGYIDQSESVIAIDTLPKDFNIPKLPVSLQIEGLSPSTRAEIVECATAAANNAAGGFTFSGCERGKSNTLKGRHWNDSFVWIDSGSHGFSLAKEQLGGFKFFRMRSVEWSGLKSPLSNYIAPVEPAVGGDTPADEQIIDEKVQVEEQIIDEKVQVASGSQPTVIEPLAAEEPVIAPSSAPAEPPSAALPAAVPPAAPTNAGGGCSLVK
ncbi:MAG: PD40 domain-containing protein [Deltaproteobacteria bacterium]|nr:PD40 domain-containing protein [Deltaproteobacteria bacterium]